MTREELVKEIESIENDLGNCEECGDYASMPYLTSILVSMQKELKAMEE